MLSCGHCEKHPRTADVFNVYMYYIYIYIYIHTYIHIYNVCCSCISHDQVVKLQEQRNVVMNEFQCYKVVPFVDLWLYIQLLWFILNFYKLPWKKIICESTRPSTVKLVNQRFLIFMCVCVYIYIYNIYIYIYYILYINIYIYAFSIFWYKQGTDYYKWIPEGHKS